MSDDDFDAPVERAGTWSTRWDRHPGGEVIPLWVADTDFRVPAVVRRALAERVQHGVLGYTAPPSALRQAIVERLARLYAWRVEPEWIVFIAGVVPGLHLAVRSLTDSDDHVLSPTPVYHHLTRAPQHATRPRTDVPLVLDRDRWVFDAVRLRKAVTPRTRMLFLCNPQNPGGTVFTRTELEAIAAATGDALIVSDEIHCDVLLEPGCRHVPMASLAPEISRRTVTLMSPNKAFNFPAAGCAWAVIEDPALRRRFCADLEAHVLPGASVFGYVAALAALREGELWLRAQCEYLRANRALVERELAPLRSGRTEATYLAWLDCSGLGVRDPWRHFLDHGVALSPGTQFGSPSFVRLNFGTQRARLQEALQRMARAISRS